MGTTVSETGNTIEEVLNKLKEQVRIIYPHMQPDGDVALRNEETGETHLYKVSLKDESADGAITGKCPFCNQQLTVSNHQHCDPNKPAMCPKCNKLVNTPLVTDNLNDIIINFNEVPLDTPINTSCSIAVTNIFNKEKAVWKGCLHFE